MDENSDETQSTFEGSDCQISQSTHCLTTDHCLPMRAFMEGKTHNNSFKAQQPFKINQ